MLIRCTSATTVSKDPILINSDCIVTVTRAPTHNTRVKLVDGEGHQGHGDRR